MYASRCSVCGGLHLPNLSDDKGPFDDIINSIAEKLFTEKIAKGTIDQALYEQTAKELLKAMHEGLGGTTFSFEDPRNSLKAYLEQNLYSFSAAKSLAEMEHMRSLLYDGNIKRSFEEFRNACFDAGYEFNVNWLRTEYNTTHAATQAAAQWQNFIDNGTEVLEYSTVGDDRVRPAHEALDKFTALISDPIWRTIYPPNDWNCRCWVIPGLSENVGAITLDKPYIKSKIPLQFQKNVGTAKVIYKDGFPYFKQGNFEEKEMQAVKNYGMMPIEKIYKEFQWPAKIEFSSVGEADAWWQNESKNAHLFVKDPNDIVIKVDEVLFKKVTRERKRWDFVGNIVDIITNPDEIWSTRTPTNLERYYIKYFQGAPLVVYVDEDNGMRAYTYVSKMKNGVRNDAAINKLRSGILVFRK